MTEIKSKLYAIRMKMDLILEAEAGIKNIARKIDCHEFSCACCPLYGKEYKQACEAVLFQSSFYKDTF
jgi:hypothetical protein